MPDAGFAPGATAVSPVACPCPFLHWSTQFLPLIPTTYLLWPWFSEQGSLGASTMVGRILSPIAGTLRGFYIDHGAPGTAGVQIDYFALVQGFATAIVLSVDAGALGGSDELLSWPVARGESVCVFARFGVSPPLTASPKEIRAALRVNP